MADPVIVEMATAGQWYKVATNSTAGFIHKKEQVAGVWQQTYVDTGEAAPTDNTTAVLFETLTLEIKNAVGIDVYIKCSIAEASVRADL